MEKKEGVNGEGGYVGGRRVCRTKEGGEAKEGVRGGRMGGRRVGKGKEVERGKEGVYGVRRGEGACVRGRRVCMGKGCFEWEGVGVRRGKVGVCTGKEGGEGEGWCARGNRVGRGKEGV